MQLMPSFGKWSADPVLLPKAQEDPLDYFTKDYETYIKDGNARWKAWFGSKVVLNTRCSKSEDE